MTHELLADRLETVAEPPFAVALVDEVLKHIGRLLRAHQLYNHNNPTYLKTVENLRACFAPVWGETESLRFEITETQLIWEGCAVIDAPEKASDSLPWILYKDGLRELTLIKGVEGEEIVALIDLIARVRRVTQEDDLLTLLWEQELRFVQYKYVDMGLDDVVPLESTPEDQRPKLIDPSKPQEPPREEIVTPGVVRLEDFDATLYFLDENELEYLRGGVQAEYASDHRANVVAMLLDTYELQPSSTFRREISEALMSLLVHMLSTGQLHSVAYLLKEIQVTAGRARALEAADRELLMSIPSRMSEPDALDQLLASLDERADLPSQADLSALFDEFRVRALERAMSWLGRLQSPKLRALLEVAINRLAAANTGELVRLIGSADADVSREAVVRSGTLKAQAAVPALARLMSASDVAVRLAAVQSLAEIASPSALQHLEKSLDDGVRDIRVAAARAFVQRQHKPALARLEAALKGKRLPDADLTEKMAFFEAYGAQCGEQGVAQLDGMLNGKSLFGRREDPELRACAAMALGRIGTENATAILRKAASDKEALVRNAVTKALRGGNA